MNIRDYYVTLKEIRGLGRLVYALGWYVANEQLAREVAEAIRHNIDVALQEQGWAHTTVERIKNALTIKPHPYGVVVTSTDKIFNILELGTRPRKMTHLLGKVIPIRVAPGYIIFRKVTPASLLRGGWRHPGTPPRYILRSVLEAVGREVVSLRLGEIGMTVQELMRFVG